MSKHRGAVPEKTYSPKQVLFELMLIDQNGYLSPDEVYQQEVVNLATKKTAMKKQVSKAGKSIITYRQEEGIKNNDSNRRILTGGNV